MVQEVAVFGLGRGEDGGSQKHSPYPLASPWPPETPDFEKPPIPQVSRTATMLPGRSSGGGDACQL